MVIILYIFDNMPSFNTATYTSILKNTNRLVLALLPFIQEIENYNIQFIYDLIQEVASIIRNKKEPILTVNNMLALTKFMQTGVYPLLLFAEIYIVPLFEKHIQFTIKNKQFAQMANFFYKDGYSSSIPNIQNLSYNYLMLVCQVIEFGTLIKPMKIYLGMQYEDFSMFYRNFEKLQENDVKVSAFTGIKKNKEVQVYRERFLLSLSRWTQYQQHFVVFFLRIFQLYLALQNSKYVQNFIEALKYGETSITSEIIARLIDVIANHQNFSVRIQALKLYDSLILWGDIQALLVINFSEYLHNMVKSIWRVKGQISLDQGVNIYPEIPNQFKEKQQFYCQFLKKIQCWAEVYPTYSYINLDNRNENNEHSPIYLIYRLLKDNKRFKFPVNSQITAFETESHKAFMSKIIRNKMISKDINGQYQMTDYKTLIGDFEQIKNYYVGNKEALLKVLNKQDNIHNNMSKLIDFKNNFQDRLELMSLNSKINDDQLNVLIQDGLELVQIINQIYYPYIQFLNTNYSEQQMIQNIISLCTKFYNPQQQRFQFNEIHSQNVLNRKNNTLNQFQERLSNPLEKKLKLIENNLSALHFRQKYRQRFDKISSSNKSPQSSINLQIFTINKNSRTSRDQQLLMFNPKPIQRGSQNKSLQFSIHSTNQKQESNIMRNTLDKPKIMLMSRINKQLLKTQQFNKRSSQNYQPTAQSTKKQPILEPTNRINTNHHHKEYNKEQLQPNIYKHEKNDQFSLSTSAGKNPLEQMQQRINMNIHIPYYQPTMHPPRRIINLNQNHHYFSHLSNEASRQSYIYAHIIIFTSYFMTVERSVASYVEGNCSKVRIVLIIIPHVQINHLEYVLQDKQCVHIEDKSPFLPDFLYPNRRYYIDITGELKKIPLKLPIITICIQKNLIFQYALPFTINHFMLSNYRQFEILDLFDLLYAKNKESFLESNHLVPSKVLFPNNYIQNASIYFPGSIFLINHELRQKLFVWQWFFCQIKLMIVLQYKSDLNILKVFGYGMNENKQKYHSFYRYVINWIAHLISERQLSQM